MKELARKALNSIKGDEVGMKHTIEFKLPKFLDSRLNKLSEEEKEKFGRLALLIGGGLLTVSVIYLTGYNRGIKKAIDNRGIYIIKSGSE